MGTYRVAVAAVAALATVAGLVPSVHADVWHGHRIYGEIEKTYHRLGGHGFFGNAIREESDAGRGGRWQEFQHHGSIYWHPDVAGGQAHQIEGLIRDAWGRAGFENGELGYPTSDELPASGGGRYNTFEHGSIYWHPQHGTHALVGLVDTTFVRHGGSAGWLGFPNGDPRPDSLNGTRYSFTNGSIVVAGHNDSSLPAYTAKRYTNYESLYVVASEKRPGGGMMLTPENINNNVLRTFDAHFPFTGCGEEIRVGTRCTLKTTLGRSEEVEVVAITPTGFALRTAAGSPEGSGRVVSFNFERITADEKGQLPEGLITGIHDIMFHRDPKGWIGLRVQSSGSLKDAKYAGPMNSKRLGDKAWTRMAGMTFALSNAYTTDFVFEPPASAEGAGVRRHRRSLDDGVVESGAVASVELAKQAAAQLGIDDEPMLVELEPLTPQQLSAQREEASAEDASIGHDATSAPDAATPTTAAGGADLRPDAAGA